ncbi:hypothetical protein [Candidatus Nitrospira bockiana]
MMPDEALNAYREHLLSALRRPDGLHPDAVESLQVIVNHESLGRMDCHGTAGSVASIVLAHSIQTVELRTDAGLLLGSLWVGEVPFKAGRFVVGESVLEVTVQNQPGQGRLRVSYSASEGFRPAEPAVQRRESRRASGAVGKNRTWAAAMSVVPAAAVAALVVLAVDASLVRWDWGSVVRSAADTEPARQVSSLEAALERQARLLDGLGRGQASIAKALEAEQADSVRLHALVRRLERSQATVSETVRQVSERVARLGEEVHIEADASARTQERGGASFVAMTAAARPEPKPTGPNGAATAPPTPADARSIPLAPFAFWVAFEDDTPERSIEALIREIHGRTGQFNSGWYNVEVSLAEPETPDGFVASLKKVKIVKAVRTSLASTR